MYVPPAFSVDDRAWGRALIDRYPFGLLATCNGLFPYVSHLPMIAYERDGELFVAGHVARANPHAESIAAQTWATAVFSGAHAFVSAAWYEKPYETVPTWNYSAVHASGQLTRADARAVLARLVDRFEGSAPGAWRLDGLDPRYLENQLRGIVAFELRVESLSGKAKLSQNRTAEDRARVERALASSDNFVDRDCARDMQEIERAAAEKRQ